MALTTSDYGTERLRDLAQRYRADDPTLTAADITELRSNTSSANWFEMVSARTVREAGKVVPMGLGRSQLQIAADYRDRAKPLLNDLLALINEARREHKMSINFQIGPPDGFDQQHLVLLEINTKLC